MSERQRVLLPGAAVSAIPSEGFDVRQTSTSPGLWPGIFFVADAARTRLIFLTNQSFVRVPNSGWPAQHQGDRYDATGSRSSVLTALTFRVQVAFKISAISDKLQQFRDSC